MMFKLVFWNVAISVSVAFVAVLGGLPGTAGTFDLLETTLLFDHDKSSSISQLIKGKSRYLQKLLNNFCVYSILNGWSFSRYLCLILNRSSCFCLFVFYSMISSIIFISSIIHFISIIIPQTSWFQRIIVTIL